MKVIREKKKDRNVTLRISEEVMKRLDKVAEEHEVSRQRLIEGIQMQVLEDKTFVLRLK